MEKISSIRDQTAAVIRPRFSCAQSCHRRCLQMLEGSDCYFGIRRASASPFPLSFDRSGAASRVLQIMLTAWSSGPRVDGWTIRRAHVLLCACFASVASLRRRSGKVPEIYKRQVLPTVEYGIPCRRYLVTSLVNSSRVKKARMNAHIASGGLEKVWVTI